MLGNGGARILRSLALLAACWLPSCILGVEPVGAPTRSRPAVTDEAPGPRPEACKKPGAACRWSPGYRHWDGGREVWVPGHWELGNERRDLVSDSGP